jgi:hypothetical protein
MNVRFAPRGAAILAALMVVCLISIPAAAQVQGQGPSAQVIEEARKAPTPRTKDGHPDLTGLWGSPENISNATRGRSAKVSEDGKTISVPLRAEDLSRPPASQYRVPENVPPYKPELLAKVKALADDPARGADPSFRCMPLGVPRMGPPTEIIQGPNVVALLYATRTTFRVIPTDGRPHNPDADGMAAGDAVGRWEGDTLVIDITNFSEDTWLGSGGWFHSRALHVVERFTRQGNTLTYGVTVEDPKVLTKPWLIPPRVLLVGKPGTHVAEDYPCVEQDQPHLTNADHH